MQHDDETDARPGVLLISDLHLRKGFEAVGLAAVDAIVAVARERRDQLDAAVLLGDVLHDHAQLHHGPVALAGRLLAELSSALHRRVFVIPGNHDMASHADFLPSVHALSVFAHIPGVHVLHRPEVVSAAGVRLLLIPYVPPGSLRDAVCIGLGIPPDAPEPDGRIVAEVRAQRVAVALGHHTVRGALHFGSAYHPAAHREAQQQDKRDSRHDAWPPAWGMDLISGHIHEPGVVGRVRYLGSVLQTAFGFEAHQPAVHILHAPWTSDPASAERIPLPSVARMRTWRIAVDPTGMPVDGEQWAERTNAPPLDTQDMWRVAIEETADAGGGQSAQRGPSPFSAHLAALRKAGAVVAVVVVPRAGVGGAGDAADPLAGRDQESDDQEEKEEALPSGLLGNKRLAARFAARWRKVIADAGVPGQIKAEAERQAEQALAR